MKKCIVYLVLIVCLTGITNAVNVGIVVEFPDNSVKTDCVSVSASASGYDILQQSTFDVTWSDAGVFGRSLCKINGFGDEVSGTVCEWDPDYFWAFYILDGDGWGLAPVGTSSYNAVDKDVIGFIRAGFASWPPIEKPPVKTYEQVCEKLNVKNIKVYVDGKKESGTDENGGKINVIPGSELELKISVENLYDKDDKIDIENIVIEGILESISDGKDLKDEASDFNLAPGRDKEVSLKFNIPLEVEEDNYDLTITVEGENENGFSYSKEIEFEVEVDKEKHDIIFNKLKFSNDNVECGKPAILEVDAVNFGINDEDVKLAISNQELGINIRESFKLNKDPFAKDNSFSKSYSIKLPANINPGTYTLFAGLSYGDKIESSTVKLNVECNDLNDKNSEEMQSTTNNPTKSKNNNPLPTTETMPTKIVGTATSTATEGKKLSNKGILMAGVFVGEIMLLIGGVVLFACLLKKS